MDELEKKMTDMHNMIKTAVLVHPEPSALNPQLQTLNPKP